MKGDDHAVYRGEIDRLVTQHGDHHDPVGFGGYYIKGTVFLGDGTAYHGGIGPGEDCYVGVSHGLAFLVYHFSLPISFLLGADRYGSEEHHCEYNKLLHVCV